MVSLADFDVRFEMAMADTPRSATPVYRDLTALVRAADGISPRRGRSNEFDTEAQPGTMTATLLNSSGDFTMSNTSSPYAPLRLRRPARVRIRYGSTAGNMVSAAGASFEDGTTGGWGASPFGYTACTIANSSTRAQTGTKSLLITWPTATAGTSAAQYGLSGFVVGRTYTMSVYVWVPAANPAVAIAELFGTVTTTAPAGYSDTSSTTGTWERIAGTFTATRAEHFLGIVNDVAATSGQTVYVDGFQVDEGATVRTFTTSPPPIYPVWQGFNDAWGNSRDGLLGIAPLRFSDRLARAVTAKMQRALVAEILYDAPRFLYPLGEAAGTTTAGDVSALSAPTLTATQLGTGGSLVFGAGVAPGPDGGTVAAFTRSNATNGVYLVQSAAWDCNSGLNGTWTEAIVRPSAAQQMVAARQWSWNDTNAYVSLGTSSSGKAQAVVYSIWEGISLTLNGTTTLPTTSDTHIAVTQSAPSGTTVTVRLLVNGTQEASGTYTRDFTMSFDHLSVGGYSGGDLWDGQISHVAGGIVQLDSGRIGQHASGRTGWAGETTDVRFSRLCRQAGLPSAHYTTTGTGLSTMSAQPTSGQPLLSLLNAVAAAESGVVYADAAGVITFAIRSGRYAADVGLTLDARKAGQLGTEFDLMTDDSMLVNDYTVIRPGGAAQRIVDNGSVASYDTHEESAELFLSTDAQARSAAQWRVYTSSQPTARSSTIEVDAVAFANSGGNVAQLLGADIGTRIQITNLPTDVVASGTADLFVEGVAPEISKDSIKITFTVSPVGASGSVMILGDATYGRLNTGGVLAF